MSMIIDNKFDIGDVVYLKTDKDQNPRIVYCIKVLRDGYLYDLACGTSTSSHYDFELSKEINVLITTTKKFAIYKSSIYLYIAVILLFSGFS